MSYLSRCLQVSVLLGSFGSSSLFALNIVIDYSIDSNEFFGAQNPNGFVGAQQARNTIEAAADFFSQILDDDFDAITPSGRNSWSAVFFDPSNSGSIISLPNLTIEADSVVIFVGGQSFAGDTLGQGSQGFFSASGSNAWLDNLFRRGEQGATRFSENPIQPWESSAPDETAFWGGSLTFDNDNLASSARDGYTWNFDHTVDPLPDEADFYSFALHEIAHVLGFGTADSFRTHVVGDTPFERRFDGEAAVAENGGMEVLLETGIDPPGHFIQGQTSNVFGTNTLQETLLDPSILLGSRELLTELDVAVFSDMGFTVVPEPSSLSLAGLAMILGLRRGRK